MPDLLQSLQSRDIGHLRIVAELYGMELHATEPEAARRELSKAMLKAEILTEVLEALPEAAQRALVTLVENGGKMPWATFTRRFGEIREVGAARRDREKIHLNPISPAEILFYRALLARAFFDTPSGAQEFAYLPDDLLALIQNLAPVAFAISSSPPLPGRPATSEERGRPLPPFDYLLDDAVTLLAALRTGITPPPTSTPPHVVLAFLRAAHILEGNEPQTETLRTFLKSSRAQALEILRQAWQQSPLFNELRLMPNLICEGEWQNDPLQARQTILRFLTLIPKGQWWNLRSFREAIKEIQPDFQRPAGDYDSWFIRRASDGVYLRGFSSWDEVDGALITYFITGPLFWLRFVELASPAEGAEPTAFRLLEGNKQASPTEDARVHVSSSGQITVPRLVPRAARYQIARFCEWQNAGPEEYRYRVTVASLQRARAQGLKVNYLLALLAKHASSEIPPAFVKAVKRWEHHGCEARLERLTVLRIRTPEILKELRRSKAARFLAEPLGPNAVAVKPGAQPHLLTALAELGWLAEERGIDFENSDE